MADSNPVEQLRATARQRDELARALEGKASRYREEAKDMRQLAGQIARARPDTTSESDET